MTGCVGPRSPAAPCRECGSRRSFNLIFDHGGTCSLLAALAATEAHDRDHRIRKRPATKAELVLCSALGAGLTGRVLTLIYARGPVRLLTFTDGTVTFDPDMAHRTGRS